MMIIVNIFLILSLFYLFLKLVNNMYMNIFYKYFVFSYNIFGCVDNDINVV